MTFEQASVRGVVRRRSDGVERTLAQAIENHLAAALAAVEHAAGESQRLVAEGKAARESKDALEQIRESSSSRT